MRVGWFHVFEDQSQTTVDVEDTVKGWESPKMKEAWGAHIMTTDSSNWMQRDSLCFVETKQRPTPQVWLLWSTKMHPLFKDTESL